MSELKGITVLSLFDGMSCAQIALNRCGFKIDRYYASEIDKHAIKVTMANYPDTIQLGSVVDIDPSTLPPIDLLCGGSPCQSFSFAGKRKGMSTKCSEEIHTLDRYLELKSDGYEFEGQSYLFWEYMRILKAVKPKYFFLENVEMGEKWEKVLSKAIGVNGVHVNSALVSAQSRKRIYWTNIGLEPRGLFGDLESSIPQPKDKGILLKDILEQEVDEKYFLSDKMLNYFKSRAANFNNGKVNIRDEDEKATCLTSSMASCDISDNFIKVDTRLRVAVNQEKSNCFTAGGNSGGMHSDMDLILQPKCGRIIGRNPENPKSRKSGIPTEQMLEVREDEKTNCLSTVSKDNVIVGQFRIPEATKKGYVEIDPGECFDFENPKSDTRRGRKMEDKSNCLMAKKTDFMQYTLEGKIRRLTPTECERLQTVPDGYTNHVSDTQRYRMLGNGWTVDVICHFFQYMNFQ